MAHTLIRLVGFRYIIKSDSEDEAAELTARLAAIGCPCPPATWPAPLKLDRKTAKALAAHFYEATPSAEKLNWLTQCDLLKLADPTQDYYLKDPGNQDEQTSMPGGGKTVFVVVPTSDLQRIGGTRTAINADVAWFGEVAKALVDTVYNRPYQQDNRVQCDRDFVAFRPNHDLTHGLRQSTMALALVDLVAGSGKGSAQHAANTLTPDERSILQLMAFMHRIGRENELGGGQDESNEKRGYELFRRVATDLGYPVNLVASMAKIMDYTHVKEDPEILSGLSGTSAERSAKEDLLSQVLAQSHRLDLQRCWGASSAESVKQPVEEFLEASGVPLNIEYGRTVDNLLAANRSMALASGVPTNGWDLGYYGEIIKKQNPIARHAALRDPNQYTAKLHELVLVVPGQKIPTTIATYQANETFIAARKALGDAISYQTSLTTDTDKQLEAKIAVKIASIRLTAAQAAAEAAIQISNAEESKIAAKNNAWNAAEAAIIKASDDENANYERVVTTANATAAEAAKKADTEIARIQAEALERAVAAAPEDNNLAEQVAAEIEAIRLTAAQAADEAAIQISNAENIKMAAKAKAYDDAVAAEAKVFNDVDARYEIAVTTANATASEAAKKADTEIGHIQAEKEFIQKMDTMLNNIKDLETYLKLKGSKSLSEATVTTNPNYTKASQVIAELHRDIITQLDGGNKLWKKSLMDSLLNEEGANIRTEKLNSLISNINNCFDTALRNTNLTNHRNPVTRLWVGFKAFCNKRLGTFFEPQTTCSEQKVREMKESLQKFKSLKKSDAPSPKAKQEDLAAKPRI